jgi:hypothetical protein
VFSGVFIAEEVDGGEDKESGDSTLIDVQAFLGAGLNMFMRSSCFIDEVFFLDKKQNFWSWD